MNTENTYKNLNKEQKEAAVMKDMIPYALYTAIPIIITIIIAVVFGPSV